MVKGPLQISTECRDLHIEISREQDRLSRRWLGPLLPELLAVTKRHRAQYDLEIREARENGLLLPSVEEARNSYKNYPLGCCELICNALWKRLAHEPVVARIQSKGLVWKQVFFIQHGRFFQNAIQCGNHLLDPANDSAFIYKPPVVCDPFDAFKHEPIDDWLRYIEIAESYLEIQVVPNRYFPMLLPLAPLLAIYPSGRVEILMHQDFLFRLDIGEDWKRVRKLVASDWWKQQTLSPDQEQSLQAFCESQPTLPIGYAKTDDFALLDVLKEWDSILKLPGDGFVNVFRTLKGLTRATGQILLDSPVRV